MEGFGSRSLTSPEQMRYERSEDVRQRREEVTVKAKEQKRKDER